MCLIIIKTRHDHKIFKINDKMSSQSESYQLYDEFNYTDRAEILKDAFFKTKNDLITQWL